MQKIILASNNPNKAKEIKHHFIDLAIEIVSQATYAIPPVAETATSFIENALIKARHASEHSKCPAIADDSGLEVYALNKTPGVYSDRYAGDLADDTENMTKLIRTVQPLSQREARFVCVMVFLSHANDATPIIAEGFWQGEIITEPKGQNGFGYDPIFYLPEYQCTAAELSTDRKNKLSHRGQAIKKLITGIKETL